MPAAARETARQPAQAIAQHIAPDTAPAMCDPECDLALPRRVYSAWTPSGGVRELVRALTPAERERLQARADALRLALLPYAAARRAEVEAEIAAMFAGFRSMRQAGAEAFATVEITARVLAHLPAWAIGRACLAIARREAGLPRPQYPPNDNEIVGVVETVMAPYRRALERAQALLAAPVERGVVGRGRKNV